MVLIRQPVGVAALITPWNFPAAMITRKVIPSSIIGLSAHVNKILKYENREKYLDFNNIRRSKELQKFNWQCCTPILNWSE